MIDQKGILNIYDRKILAIIFALSTLLAMFPAHAEEGDFLNNISKLEIKNPHAPEASAGGSTAGSQARDSGGKATAPKQDAVRKKPAQSNKTESTINALRKQNAELSNAVKAAEKKLEQTTRELSAQIAALKAESGHKESGDPAVVVLSRRNDELTVAAGEADETIRSLSAHIAALKTENAQAESQHKVALDALSKKNDELTAVAETARKKLDETTRSLSAQIAALKTENARNESEQKKALDALTKKNGELTVAAGAARKKLDETTRSLSAQIADLKTQNTRNESEQKKALDALSKKNAELIAAAETAQKKYAASVQDLNSKNKKLQSALDRQTAKKSDLNLTSESNKNAYALGFFYLTQALADVNKMADNNIKLTPSALVSGFNDAYNKTLLIKENEIETIINTLNDQMSSKYVDIEKRVLKVIKNKKYEILPNGVYFVIDKKGTRPYKLNESLSMNIMEKRLDGTPILNTMNSKLTYNKDIEPLMEKILSSGLKGGTVTLYGQAGSLYSDTPADIKPDTLISITFELIP